MHLELGGFSAVVVVVAYGYSPWGKIQVLLSNKEF